MGTDRVELPEPEAGGLQPLGIAAFPVHPHREALGRIRTSNHQVRSLALWSIELRGQVSCTCEWRMRASNPPVVPGANRVTTPSSPIPQSSASTGRGSRTPTENLHWFLRPARLPIPPYRCVCRCCTGMARIELATYRSTSGCSATEPHPQRCQRWGERRSNPRLPGFNRALGPSQLPPHGVGVTYQLSRGSGEAPDGIEPS